MTAISPVTPLTAATPRSPRRSRAGSGAQQKAGWVAYVVIMGVALLSLLPLYWTTVVASHTNAEMAAGTPPFVPNGSIFHNITLALQQADIGRAILNSTIVAGSITIGTVLFCTLAGFAFAKLKFRGSNILLGVVIATIAVPTQLGIIPLFIMIAKLHWINQLQAVILPTLVSAFGVFFMRQFLAQSLPTEIIEAALVDGANTFRIFRSIVLPVARPAMAVLGMLTFLAAWNDFFWPIVALNGRNPTVQVALAGLSTGYIPQQAVIMAGTLIGTLPILVVFGVLGRQIVGGIMQGAVKG